MKRHLVAAGFLVLGGCASPQDFIQKGLTDLNSLAGSFTTYEGFKDTIRLNAYYARIAYADMTNTGYSSVISALNKKKGSALYNNVQLGDVCLGYVAETDLKYKDIQKRFNALQKLLGTAETMLCSAPMFAKGATAGICPASAVKDPYQALNAFVNAVNQLAKLTPLSSSVSAGVDILTLIEDVAQFTQLQQQYIKAINFLGSPATQRHIKYAVTRLEGDLKGLDKDLEDNMRTWSACETARLNLAAKSLRWGDGASALVFSSQARDYQQKVDAVQTEYLKYKNTFVSETRKSLEDLGTALAKVPTLMLDPFGNSSALQDIVKAFEAVDDDLTKLAASSSGTKK
jgi:hypothetical protein